MLTLAILPWSPWKQFCPRTKGEKEFWWSERNLWMVVVVAVVVVVVPVVVVVVDTYLKAVA